MLDRPLLVGDGGRRLQDGVRWHQQRCELRRQLARRRCDQAAPCGSTQGSSRRSFWTTECDCVSFIGTQCSSSARFHHDLSSSVTCPARRFAAAKP